MILDSSCVHWWMIDRLSVGRCRKCGAIRDFEKLMQEEKKRKPIHKINR